LFNARYFLRIPPVTQRFNQQGGSFQALAADTEGRSLI
jgi:hypothetical protein